MDSAVQGENSSFQNGNTKVTRIQTGGGNGNEVRIFISDGPSFFISLQDKKNLEIYEGLVLSPSGIESLKNASEYYTAYKKALDLIAQAEHTKFQLLQKLLKRSFSPDISNKVCDDLVDKEFVNDSRYAELWLESRCRRRGEGPARLIAGLQQRGVSREKAEASVEKYFDEVSLDTVFKKAVEKEKRRCSGDPDKLRKRLYYLGFPHSIIKSYLKNNH